jgi:hypothetical protein
MDVKGIKEADLIKPCKGFSEVASKVPRGTGGSTTVGVMRIFGTSMILCFSFH